MKLNERTKQMKQIRFLKAKLGKKSVVANNSCNKWNNLNVKLRNMKSEKFQN